MSLFLFIATQAILYIIHLYLNVFHQDCTAINHWSVESGGRGAGGLHLPHPHIFHKVDHLPIDNESEKQKVARNKKTLEIPQKLLLALSSSCNA